MNMVLKDPKGTIADARRLLDAYTRRKLEDGLHMNQKTVDKLRKGRPVKQETVDRLAKMLKRRISDIAEPYDPDIHGERNSAAAVMG